MKNLLIITQKVDESDDLLGFFTDWLDKFSKHFDTVSVITLSMGKHSLPGNVEVYSLGKERNAPKIYRFFKFYGLLFRLVPRSAGIFCHMSPIFAVASWSVAAIFSKRIILWYSHRSLTLRLKLAEKLVYRIATASKKSLTLKSDKIIELGHGIDIERFRTARTWSDWPNKTVEILSVGRISRIKNYETLIRAARKLKDKGKKIRVTIVGRPVMPRDRGYYDELKQLVAELDLHSVMSFKGFVPYSEIPPYYKKADICVNLTPKGGMDKTVLEAIAAGCIILTSNEATMSLLGSYADKLLFKHGNPEDLVRKLISIFSLSAEEILLMSDDLMNPSIKNSSERVVERLSKLFT